MLSARGLAVARGGVPVLDGLDFEVPAGGALILRGRNGIGKTTLLRTLAGLQPAHAGEVAPDLSRIAYGAHADGMKGVLSVEENLRFWAALHGTGPIGAALAAFDLGALAERPAQYLSAGQKRRLGLARMLVTGRPVWLLDEPTVSLDAENVIRFAGAVRAHLAGGGAALIATHVDLGLDAPVLELGAFRARHDIAAWGDGVA